MIESRAAAACKFLSSERVRGNSRGMVGRVGARADESSSRRRGARMFDLIVMSVVAIAIAGCSSLVSYPRPACLYDKLGRYDTGKVIAKRAQDDAQLFEFNDRTKGDNGFQWVAPGGDRMIRACREATLMDVDDPFRRMQPEDTREVES